MLWYLVGNWQQRRSVDHYELEWQWPVSRMPRNYPVEQGAETIHWHGSHNFRISHEEKRKHTQWVSATIWVQVWQETPYLTRPECKGGKTRRRLQVSHRSTATDCLRSWWSNSRSTLPTDTLTSPPPSLTRVCNYELEPNIADLRVDHHLWGDWTFIWTSLFLSLNWRLDMHWVAFASTHFAADKLFPVIPWVISRYYPCYLHIGYVICLIYSNEDCMLVPWVALVSLREWPAFCVCT